MLFLFFLYPQFAKSQSFSPPDLSAYRTTANAITTAVPKNNLVPNGQTAFLGLHTSVDARGRLLVSEVAPGSPAAKAGILPGDHLLKLDGQPVSQPSNVRDLVQGRGSDDRLAISYERNQKQIDTFATLGSTSRPLRFNTPRVPLGARLTDWSNGEGAEVDVVGFGTVAEEAGIRRGDVITRIDGESVANADIARAWLEEKHAGDRARFVILRKGEEIHLDARYPATTEFRENRARSYWKKNSFRIAVVPIEFDDLKHDENQPLAHWNEFFFSTNSYANKNSESGQPVYGSVNDYYLEVSAGALQVEGKVFDWVTANHHRADYVESAKSSNRPETPLLTEALEKLEAREGEAALNGFDGLLFIYAGDRFPNASRSSLYWPHMGLTIFRNKRWNMFICAEGRRKPADISEFCHEFGHLLGLPDLYARPDIPTSEGLGPWCLMSQQSGGGRPQHPSAWCKEQLGWIKPVVIDPTVKQKLILSPIEGSATECFKILTRRDGSEYFLLENRRHTNFDCSLPAEGLLIWRVVGNRPTLVESHGVTGPSGPLTFLSTIPYPSQANTSFTPYTSPSSRSALGGGLPVNLTQIRQLPDGRITFLIGYEFD